MFSERSQNRFSELVFASTYEPRLLLMKYFFMVVLCLRSLMSQPMGPSSPSRGVSPPAAVSGQRLIDVHCWCRPPPDLRHASPTWAAAPATGSFTYLAATSRFKSHLNDLGRRHRPPLDLCHASPLLLPLPHRGAAAPAPLLCNGRLARAAAAAAAHPHPCPRAHEVAGAALVSFVTTPAWRKLHRRRRHSWRRRCDCWRRRFGQMGHRGGRVC